VVVCLYNPNYPRRERRLQSEADLGKNVGLYLKTTTTTTTTKNPKKQTLRLWLKW
jgi:hypothetical protein